ncbi:exosortase N [Pontibacter sp. BT310]|uniref:Exosortase N n=1 Tax=Pontibacter populi TaxID=890055 RepID=A0ABS6XFA8_9BACT|nr:MULTISPECIES: exosortase N [Pontibacter]MBJ6119031.1 exosortase N [Pontibacter sp. BT310]MBR0571459.1 exosortase N [Microvirga sp. STS03]MBW3365885.1 exosortase N [Pontibacter populi]
MKLTALRPTEQLLIPLLVLGLYLLVAGIFLSEYLLWDSQWALAMVLVPFVAQVQPQKSLSPALLIATIVLALLAATLQNSTLYFFTSVVALWCGAQLIVGRISIYPILLLVVASPIFKYIANIISFPLRMQLTTWAVAIFNTMEKQAEAAGNIILVNEEEFSVDPACAGLSMLSLALILAVFILAHLQKTYQKNFPILFIGMMLCFMLLLNLVANLLRILLLVWFKILPGNPLHDVLGLLCLLIYALVPFYFTAKRLQQYLSNASPNASPKSAISLRGSLLLNYLLLLMLTGTGLTIKSEKPVMALEQTIPQLHGFQATTLENGVTKYSNENVLVYLKPIQAFYSTEHHPLICWEGSGYKFRHVQQRQIGNYNVYVGELQKGKDTLYTAWWMDNGLHQTIDQWDWRTRMLKGEAKFRLVNVTVAQKQELPEAIVTIIANQTNYSHASTTQATTPNNSQL